jgi:magnesium-transporting ATPase (P-type)
VDDRRGGDSVGRGPGLAGFFIILLLLVSNAVVGFWEEHQAGNAIAALKAKLAIKARVKRDGKWITPAARELVPGDVIRVRLGEVAPADAACRQGCRSSACAERTKPRRTSDEESRS